MANSLTFVLESAKPDRGRFEAKVKCAITEYRKWNSRAGKLNLDMMSLQSLRNAARKPVPSTHMPIHHTDCNHKLL